ncbi:MAG: Flp pilus assembly protein CpaB [Alphaproteobacteria bacterium]|nr:Flp pilus assembly protein CpaB [Alphaproteobacteria bacterium]
MATRKRKSRKSRKFGPEQRRQLSAAAIVALVSLAVSGIGAVLIVHVLSTLQATLASALAEREKVVAVPMVGGELEAGDVIDAEDLVSKDLLATFVHPECVMDRRLLEGRTLLARIYPGECIRMERLAPVDSKGGLEALVPRGMRAMTLNLPIDAQVSGFIQPGASVDVITTVVGDKLVETETRTAAEGLRVLAVGSWVRESERGEMVTTPTVTLAVQPDVAELLAHATTEASIRLALRSSIDFWPADVTGDGVTTRRMLGRVGGRVSVAEYRERIDDAAYEHMLVMIAGPEVERVPVVDPRLIRDLPTKTEVGP